MQSTFRSQSFRPVWSWAGCFLVLAAFALWIDLPVSLARPVLPPEAVWTQLWTLPELFGDGCGVILICLCIFLFDHSRRGFVPRVIFCTLAAGIAASMTKPIILRTRPREFGFDAGVLSTFEGTLPWNYWFDDTFLLNSDVLSFPSAHAATAVGMAIGLTWLYPRHRSWFIALAVAAAGQRVIVGAHFVSDTLAGAALGCVVASFILNSNRAHRFFHRWEHAASSPVLGRGELGSDQAR